MSVDRPKPRCGSADDDVAGGVSESAHGAGRDRRGDQLPAPETMLAALEASQDAVCFLDVARGRVTYANPAAERLFGLTGGQWASLTVTDLVEGQEEESWRRQAGFAPVRIRPRKGEPLTVEWALFGSSSGRTAVAVFRPIAVCEPISQTDRDPLTGLLNRTVFERRLAESLEQKRTDYAVLFVDLDDFKQVNDRFGHALGDRVLRAIAERLAGALRPVDTVARYGGDEFIILLQGLGNKASARKVARRLLRAIASPVDVQGGILRVGASVGIVLSEASHTDREAVVRAADEAMYRAKKLGSGRYAFSDR